MDDISVLMDLVVGGSKRARENVIASLLNLVKSDEDKVAGTSGRWMGQRQL